MLRGALEVERRKCPCRAQGCREPRCASSVPPIGTPSTPATRRPPTSTTSTAIWCAGATGHCCHAGRSLPAREDSFDGVDVVRFPLELPSDLTYGRVAQSRVSLLGRFARLAVMAHYMEAQYRAIVAVGRARRRRRSRALGDTDRSRRRACRAQARGSQHHHHARRRRLRESRAGVRFSDPMVRAAGAALDPAPRRRAHRNYRRLPAARAARRCARAMHPAGLQRHRSPPLQSIAQRQRAWIRASGPT